MKKNFLCLFVGTLFFFIDPSVYAQTNNWSNLDSVKNNIRMYGGLDFGLVYGLQYGRIYKTKKIRWLPYLDLSLPAGQNIVDDYRFNAGTNLKLIHYKAWIGSVDIAIGHRQNRNPFVKMKSFGSELGIQFGYYKPKWFANLHFSTENSWITHLKHSEAYKGNYSMVKDGWYQNTANNQIVGLNIGYSFKKIDITLSSGIIRTNAFKDKPTLPMFGKIGINYRF